jgi:hypothetical protein
LLVQFFFDNILISSPLVQTRLCRQLKYTENDLIIELQSVQHDRQLFSNYYHSTSLAEGLQEVIKSFE